MFIRWKLAKYFFKGLLYVIILFVEGKFMWLWLGETIKIFTAYATTFWKCDLCTEKKALLENEKGNPSVQEVDVESVQYDSRLAGITKRIVNDSALVDIKTDATLTDWVC